MEAAFLRAVNMPNIDAAIAQTWLTVGPLPVHGCRLLRQAARRATRDALALQAYNGNVGDAVAAFREVTNGDARNFTHTRRHAHTDTRAPASLLYIHVVYRHPYVCTQPQVPGDRLGFFRRRAMCGLLRRFVRRKAPGGHGVACASWALVCLVACIRVCGP